MRLEGPEPSSTLRGVSIALSISHDTAGGGGPPAGSRTARPSGRVQRVLRWRTGLLVATNAILLAGAACSGGQTAARPQPSQRPAASPAQATASPAQPSTPAPGPALP